MQYLLMCCINDQQWESVPQQQRDAIMREYGNWVQGLGESGHYITGAKLQASGNATTVRAKNGKVTVVDGPFAETKEQLGGYHVLECRDLDEALAFARRVPTLPVGGTIEVRPIAYVTGGARQRTALEAVSPP